MLWNSRGSHVENIEKRLFCFRTYETYCPTYNYKQHLATMLNASGMPFSDRAKVSCSKSYNVYEHVLHFENANTFQWYLPAYLDIEGLRWPVVDIDSSSLVPSVQSCILSSPTTHTTLRPLQPTYTDAGHLIPRLTPLAGFSTRARTPDPPHTSHVPPTFST